MTASAALNQSSIQEDSPRQRCQPRLVVVALRPHHRQHQLVVSSNHLRRSAVRSKQGTCLPLMASLGCRGPQVFETVLRPLRYQYPTIVGAAMCALSVARHCGHQLQRSSRRLQHLLQQGMCTDPTQRHRRYRINPSATQRILLQGLHSNTTAATSVVCTAEETLWR